MNRKRSQLQSYFAGLLDGEGHFGIVFNGSTYNSRIAVQMDDPQGILLMWREYPDAQFYVRRHPTGKVFYRLEFRTHDVQYTLLQEMVPFLIVKHEQAKVLESFIVHRRREHFKQRKPNCARCQRLQEMVLGIRARTKGVNTVDALLSHELREYRAKREDVEADVTVMRRKLEELLEGVETRDRATQPVEPISAPEQDIVHVALHKSV